MNNSQKNNKVIEKIISFFQGVYRLVFGIVRPLLTQLFEIMDEGKLSARAAIWTSLGITIYALWWCFGFAAHPPANFGGTEIAAIIGAILTPLAGLTGAMMKYGEQVLNIKKAKQDNSNGE